MMIWCGVGIWSWLSTSIVSAFPLLISMKSLPFWKIAPCFYMNLYWVISLFATNISYSSFNVQRLEINRVWSIINHHRCHEKPLQNTRHVHYKSALFIQDSCKAFTFDPIALLAGWKMIDPMRERIMMIKPNVFRMIDSLGIVWPGVCEIVQFTMIPWIVANKNSTTAEPWWMMLHIVSFALAYWKKAEEAYIKNITLKRNDGLDS